MTSLHEIVGIWSKEKAEKAEESLEKLRKESTESVKESLTDKWEENE